MISLIYGGSGSGKSEYAEGLVLQQSDPGDRYYIATMQAYGEEGQRRIQRHRSLRAGKGFQTIECQAAIETALQQIPDPSRATILLECVSNLLANEMFADTEQKCQERSLEDDILTGISRLCSSVKNAVIVTNNVFEDGTDYDEPTVRYMEHLGAINCRLAQEADQVIEVVAGIPVVVCPLKPSES